MPQCCRPGASGSGGATHCILHGMLLSLEPGGGGSMKARWLLPVTRCPVTCLLWDPPRGQRRNSYKWNGCPTAHHHGISPPVASSAHSGPHVQHGNTLRHARPWQSLDAAPAQKKHRSAIRTPDPARQPPHCSAGERSPNFMVLGCSGLQVPAWARCHLNSVTSGREPSL